MAEKECDYCKLAESSLKMYEDDHFVVVLHPRPAFQGHTIIIPKKHYNIFEQLSDMEAGLIFSLANKVSSALFESLNIQGTNILVQNGPAAGQDQSHVSLHIVPRNQDDNLGLTWQPRQLDEEQMSTVELTLKDEISKSVFADESEKKPEIHPSEHKPKHMKHDEENYLIKSLTRIP